jgi:outer membrane protein assembly factor BamA
MEFRELVRLFVHIIDITKNEGYRFEHIKVKNFHLNPDAKIDRDIKKNICNVLNGKMTVNTSINKIQQAKEQLQQEGKKITQVEVARVCGLSLKTVKNHYKKTPVDIEELVEIFNDSITPTRPTGIRFKDRLDWEGTDTKEGEYIHPECPQWVLEYEF